MLVSIIIPIHKTTSFLKECVISALQQTYTNIEVLLVCNGNLSIKECAEFLSIENQKLLFYKSEKGRHHARNLGIKMAKGVYLQFLDFDDILFPQKIEKQINSLNNFEDSKAVSITKWEIFSSETGKRFSQDLDYLFEKRKINGLELYKLLGKNKGYIMTASWLFPRKLISDTIFWEDVPNDDALFASEIIKIESLIITVPEVLTAYRNHNNNTRSIRTKKELNKLIYSWEKIRVNLAFNDFLVERYFYNAYFYMLKYSINCRGYRFLKIYKIFKQLSVKAKIPIKLRMDKDLILFKKYVGLVFEKIIK